VNREYGPPENLRLVELEQPAVEADGVLVRIGAASVNPFDWHVVRGHPYIGRLVGMGFRRPKRSGKGVDLAGTVEAVGENVTALAPGDEVYGTAHGAFAEYVAGTVDDFVPKPVGLTFEQAAAIPMAGTSALQALRDRGQLQPGQRVLINGAAGGVGTFAVQIAKAFGAEVTGVCSTRNVELVQSLGASHVVDYTRDDFTRSGPEYDVIVDTVGNHALRHLRRALTPTGTLVIVGGGRGRLIGGLAQLPKSMVLDRFVQQRLARLFAKLGNDDLVVLTQLVDEGKVTPVIDRAYPLAETAEAIRYVEAGHARGKVVISVSGAPADPDRVLAATPR
jgi:NADPH:quinone reductase-like Zn-dependent oxidoreductase